MKRGFLLIASVFLTGATSTAPIDASASEQRAVPVVSRTIGSVPLPISRPVWGDRVSVAGSATADSATAQATDRSVAPAPDGSGLKSGSAEALAMQLEGARVVSSEGDVVGEVEKVIEQSGGKQAVISVGGFLGIGASRILIPADNLVPSGKGMVRTTLTEQQLKSLPAYEM